MFLGQVWNRNQSLYDVRYLDEVLNRKQSLYGDKCKAVIKDVTFYDD